MRVVNDHGHIYRMTEKRFRAYLVAGASGQHPDASDYGKLIAFTDFNATRAVVEDFQSQLDMMGAE